MKSNIAGWLAVCAFIAPVAALADYPDKPVKIIVPQAQGGGFDLAGRIIGQKLSDLTGQQFIVENKPGGGTLLGTQTVAKSTPDGYTLLLHADSGITINPHVYAKLPFDALKDLLPVTSVATNQFMLSLNPQVPVKTFPEFIEYARKTTPPLPYASGGNGSQHQLMMEMLKQRAKIDLLHVPFRGAAPATTATVAGDTKVLFSGSASASLIQSGQLRAVATSGKKRAPRFPDLPTIGEFYPGYAVDIWLGLFAPAGTPEPIVTRLRTEVHKLLSDAEFAKKLNVSGSLEPLVLSPAEFSKLIRDDYEKYGQIVRQLGISIN